MFKRLVLLFFIFPMGTAFGLSCNQACEQTCQKFCHGSYDDAYNDKNGVACVCDMFESETPVVVQEYGKKLIPAKNLSQFDLNNAQVKKVKRFSSKWRKF
jgi:hypothetical protein